MGHFCCPEESVEEGEADGIIEELEAMLITLISLDEFGDNEEGCKSVII